MESLGEILKRLPRRVTSGESTAASSTTEKEVCPRCQGMGFLTREVPLGHPDFGRAFPCECKAREYEAEKRASLERYSNLGPLTSLTFENLIPRGRSGNSENQERFARALEAAQAFAREPSGWLTFFGASGSGKTHLAAAIANAILAQGKPAFFVQVSDLLDHLRAAYRPESELEYDELFERVRGTPALILDDLGTQSSTPWAQEKLFQILNHRFSARLPTIITLGVPPEELEERLRTRLEHPPFSRLYELERKALPSLQEIPRGMTFENFDPRGLNADWEQRENLRLALTAARRFAEAPEGWLVFTGPPGRGKTHLAAAIADYQEKRGKTVLFLFVPDLLDELRSTFSPDSKVNYNERFERVRTAPLLVLDDLDTRAASPWAWEKLYQIINYRYQARLPMVVTTTLELEKLAEMEPRLASRLADPKISHSIAIIAPDYRMGPKPEEKPRPGRRPRRNQEL